MERESTIDGGLLRRMLHSGFTNLSHNKNYLNDLNIFPVSDCDTGTNMKITFEKGIAALKGEASFHGVLSAFVKDMSLGSRGNSGFILSQYFLGIHEYIKDNGSVTAADLCDALQHAYMVAYRAVIQPAEGTMLTVMRDGIKRTLPKINGQTSAKEFFDVLVEEMFLCVQETVKQMDVLRENNVVDSGALGLYLIFDGMKKAFNDDSRLFDCEQSESLPKRVPPALVKNVSFFRYCTEFALRLREVKGEEYFVRLLTKKGDSIVAAANENILKVHIHTNRPREITDEFSKYGDIITKKIDDLFLTQEFERLKQRKHEGFAVVAFTDGEGIAAALEQIGADVAFSVPFGHRPGEEDLKTLLGGFLMENLIVFPDSKDMHDKLKRIQWFSNYQNLYVAEYGGLAKTFFTLSSLVFTDEFKNVVKSLESLKKQRVFQTSIRQNYTRYSGVLRNKIITLDDFAGLLNAVAGGEVLRPYSTAVVFGGKYCKSEDADAVRAHFEQNANLEFAYIDGRQHDCDFIIGAY